MRDLSGLKFNRYTVIRFSHRKNRDYYWLCRCECGNEKIVRANGLTTGGSKSCGCLRTEKRVDKLTTHGNTKENKKTPEYNSWQDMRNRCFNANFKQYHDYGGRGITVCERWSEFANFLSDMGKKPSKYHSLERIDNNKGYSPDNCKWADKTTQQRNQRTRKDNTSGHRGVYQLKNNNKFIANISVNKKVIHLGSFSKFEDAVKAREEAEKKYW